MTVARVDRGAWAARAIHRLAVVTLGVAMACVLGGSPAMARPAASASAGRDAATRRLPSASDGSNAWVAVERPSASGFLCGLPMAAAAFSRAWVSPGAMVVSVFVGLSYMTASMVQFDLAARACPIHAAGTTFAMLMSLSNLSLSLSAALGGWLFDRWAGDWGETTAFRLLVLAGAMSTSLCWFLVPWIYRSMKYSETKTSPAAAEFNGEGATPESVAKAPDSIVEDRPLGERGEQP